MSPHDFGLSASHLARSLCHPKMVLPWFSCTSTISTHHSQHLVCICSNILLNVEGQVKYQHLYIFWQQDHTNVEIHYQCHLYSSSIPSKHCRSFDMLCMWLGCVFTVAHGLIDSEALKTTENDKMCSNGRVAVSNPCAVV